MARTFWQKGQCTPIWALWQYHFVYGDAETAAKLWKEFYAVDRHFRYYFIMDVARKTNDPKLIIRLLDVLGECSISRKALGLAHSCLLTIHAENTEFDSLEKALKLAVQEVSLANLNAGALYRTKKVLESVGKRFEYEIPRIEAQKGKPGKWIKS